MNEYKIRYTMLTFWNEIKEYQMIEFGSTAVNALENFFERSEDTWRGKFQEITEISFTNKRGNPIVVPYPIKKDDVSGILNQLEHWYLKWD